MNKSQNAVKKIKDILKKDTRGLTIEELSKAIRASRIATAIALAKLEGAKLVDVRVIGNCKLHYWIGKK